MKLEIAIADVAHLRLLFADPMTAESTDQAALLKQLLASLPQAEYQYLPNLELVEWEIGGTEVMDFIEELLEIEIEVRFNEDPERDDLQRWESYLNQIRSL